MQTETVAKPRAKRSSHRAARTVDRRAARPGPQNAALEVDQLWEVADVAQYLQLSASSVYKMTGRKAVIRIPHIRIGGKLRFRRSDVDRWLTLLTVSNTEVLSHMREKASKVAHGNDSQTQTPKR